MTYTTTDEENPLLVLEDYRIGFKTERGLAKAVDGVSLSLKRGQTLGIVGESGSGKTVLNRGVMGLLAASNTVESGSAKFEGEELVGENRQLFWGTKMAMIFQDPMTSLNPVMKVGNQVIEPLRQHQKLSKSEAKERVARLFTLVGIPEPIKRLNQYPHELSGGMRQRVMISIALAIEPDLLIADEPTTSLDVTVQKYILDLLTRVQKEQGMSMVLITHDLGVARGRADEILVMYGGRVMEHAPTEELFGSMSHPYTAALFSSIPHLHHKKHTRLTPIPGIPPDIVEPPTGCRFAPRCTYAQERCLLESPPMTHEGNHRFACFFPVGTRQGQEALTINQQRGHTASGLQIRKKDKVT
jgi:peptide/nickel transport system ATP-binding protein